MLQPLISIFQNVQHPLVIRFCKYMLADLLKLRVRMSLQFVSMLDDNSETLQIQVDGYLDLWLFPNLH